MQDGRDRPEKFLAIGPHPWRHLGDPRWRVKEAAPLDRRPAGQQPGTPVQRILDLAVQRFVQIRPGQRGEAGLLVERVAVPQSARRFDEALPERRGFEPYISKSPAASPIAARVADS